MRFPLPASLRPVVAGAFAVLTLAIASCSRSDSPTSPVERPTVKLDCLADVRALTIACPGATTTADGLSLNVVLGGQGVNIRLTSTNVQYSAGTATFSADVTVQNLIEQPIGTSDGISLDPNGVRVFFHSGPTVTAGTGPAVTVKNADGSGSFTGPGQPYFQYNEVLDPNEISSTKSWQWWVTPSIESFTFSVYVDAPVQYAGDHVDVEPRRVLLTSDGQTQTFTGVRRRVNGDVLAGPPVTWNSSDPDVAEIDPNTGELTTHATGTVTITGTSGTLTGIATVQVEEPVTGAADSYDATGNIAIQRSAGSGPLSNDGVSGLAVSEVNGSASNVGTWTNTTTAGRNGTFGRVKLNADGSFDYDPPPGYTGIDQFTYRASKNGVTSAPLTVTVGVSAVGDELMWFVCDGCTSTDQGTLLNPFTSVAAFSAANTGAPLSPQTSHSVHIADGTYNGASDRLTLLNSQKAYGAAIARSTVYSPESGSHPSFYAGFASRPVLAPPSGAVVTLASDNTVGGMTLTTPSGGDGMVSGAGFGTLTVDLLGINGAGRALLLTGGTLVGGINPLSSTGGINNIALFNVVGPDMRGFGTASDALSGATGTAIAVSGGSISFNYFGSVSKSNGAALLSVSNGHTGQLTFNSVAASAGSGLQFDNADGTYTFNGTTSLQGVSSGVNIVGGSSGTFSFGTGTAIGTAVTPTGPAFRVNGSTPGILYAGSITQGTALAPLVDITDQASGSISFHTGTLHATNGTGITLSNFDGTVNFAGTTTLAGGDAGVDIINGSSGVIRIQNGIGSFSILNPTGIALNVNASAPDLRVNGSITGSAGRLVDIFQPSPSPCGTISIGAALNASATSTGLRVSQCTSGTITFSGTTQNLNTASNPAVTLSSNLAETAVSFTGGNLNIQTTTGEGLTANGGTLSVTGSNNVINSTFARAINVSGLTIPAAGVTFQSVSSGSGTNNIAINTSSGTGAVNLGSGALSGAFGHAFALNGNSVPITYSGTISKSESGAVVSVSSQSANQVTIAGNLDCTGNCTGITVSGNFGGSTINFTGGSKILNATSAFVQLVNNGASGGSTTNFTNGGLQLTSVNNGFTVSSGGTVNVTTGGLPNTISVNGPATALNVSNATIGSSNLTFRSISSNGAAGNGILLSNTGAGRLIITGNGGTCSLANSTLCTGGVIQNSTGDGISLISTVNPSLSFMKVASTSGHGISGFSVVGMNLSSVVIDNAGNSAGENALNFTTGTAALTGTVDWTNVGINEPAANGAFVTLASGSLTIFVTNSTFQYSSLGAPGGGVVTGGDLLRFTTNNSSSITATVSGSAFWYSEFDGIAAYANGGTGPGSGSTIRLTVNNSTFRGREVGFGGRNAIYMQGFNGTVMRFNLFGNTSVRNWISDAIGVLAGDNANVQGAIASNTIGDATLQSGSRDSRGISLKSQGSATLIATVTSNTIRETYLSGIWANAFSGTGLQSVQATITNNTLPTSPRNPLAVENVLFVRDGGVGCARVSLNGVANGAAGANAIRLLGNTPIATFNLHGGPANATDAAATAYLQGQNSSTNPAFISATNPTLWQNGSCASPLVP